MKYSFSSDEKDLLSHLPVEICFQILNLLSAKDLQTCCQVSKTWNKLSNDQLLWLNRCIEIKVPRIMKTQEPLLQVGESLKQEYFNYSTLLSNWQNINQIKPVLISLNHDSIITGLLLFENLVISCSEDGTVTVLDMLLCKTLHSYRVHMNGIWALEVFRIGDQIMVATSSTDCTVRVWKLFTAKNVFVFRGHENIIRCLATSINEEANTQKIRLISGSRDSTLRVWDLKSGQCLYVLIGHIGAVRSVRADSNYAVSGSYDHSIRVWNLNNGTCIYVLIGHTNRIYTLYLGKLFILSSSLDTTIRIWNREDGLCALTLSGHRSLTCEITMNTEESLAISGNADKTVRVWDIKTGQCLLVLGGNDMHLSAVTSVHVILDRFVVSSGADGTVKLWNLNNGKFIREIVRLDNTTSNGAIVWRSVSNNDYLICSTGSRNKLQMNRIFLFDFSVKKKIL